LRQVFGTFEINRRFVVVNIRHFRLRDNTMGTTAGRQRNGAVISAGALEVDRRSKP